MNVCRKSSRIKCSNIVNFLKRVNMLVFSDFVIYVNVNGNRGR